jgi:hypothetical protein
LWQALGERFPIVSARSAAIDSEFSVEWVVFRVALDWDNVDGFGFVSMDRDGKSEVSGQIAAHFLPRFASIITPHDIPMFLHE